MKHALSAVVGVVVAVVLTGFPAAQCAWADDESDEVEIKIRAPLDDCIPSPPTIVVLGLMIDAGGDVVQVGEDATGPLDCTQLAPNEVVKVELASDTTASLKATKIELRGSDEGDEAGDGGDENVVKVQAPFEGLTTVGASTGIILLGGRLTIDVTHAVLEGADDESDGDEQPIDLTTLMTGTFVEVTLDLMLTSDIPGAFVATTLEVKNFTNHVDVEVLGPDGEVVDDRDAAGNPVNDVRVELTETVKVHGARRGRGGRSKRVLHFHTRSNGSVVLSGLPTGHGKVRATRVVGGSTMTGQGRVVVGPNGTRHRRIVLHHAG